MLLVFLNLINNTFFTTLQSTLGVCFLFPFFLWPAQHFIVNNKKDGIVTADREGVNRGGVCVCLCTELLRSELLLICTLFMNVRAKNLSVLLVSYTISY